MSKGTPTLNLMTGSMGIFFLTCLATYMQNQGEENTGSHGGSSQNQEIRAPRGTEGDPNNPNNPNNPNPNNPYDPNDPNAQNLWRGTMDIDPNALAALLPDAAKPYAQDFITIGNQYGINPLILVAISRHETGNWTSNAFRNGNNAMGVSNASGPIAFSSVRDSINQQAASLAGAPGTGGYYNNAQTIAQLGAIYAPVGANNDPRNLNQHWTGSVSRYYQSYLNQLR